MFVIRTPEQRLQVICMDPVAKSKALVILNKTINGLVKPSKNKRVDFQFAVSTQLAAFRLPAKRLSCSAILPLLFPLSMIL